MLENFISKWTKNEKKNLIEFYINYKITIQQLSSLLNKTEYDIKNKLIELKIVNSKNPIFNENEFIDYFDYMNILCKISNDLKVRIKVLENKIKN
jgi:hypothetical protein